MDIDKEAVSMARDGIDRGETGKREAGKKATLHL